MHASGKISSLKPEDQPSPHPTGCQTHLTEGNSLGHFSHGSLKTTSPCSEETLKCTVTALLKLLKYVLNKPQFSSKENFLEFP